MGACSRRRLPRPLAPSAAPRAVPGQPATQGTPAASRGARRAPGRVASAGGLRGRPCSRRRSCAGRAGLSALTCACSRAVDHVGQPRRWPTVRSMTPSCGPCSPRRREAGWLPAPGLQARRVQSTTSLRPCSADAGARLRAWPGSRRRVHETWRTSPAWNPEGTGVSAWLASPAAECGARMKFSPLLENPLRGLGITDMGDGNGNGDGHGQGHSHGVWHEQGGGVAPAGAATAARNSSSGARASGHLASCLPRRERETRRGAPGGGGGQQTRGGFPGMVEVLGVDVGATAGPVHGAGGGGPGSWEPPGGGPMPRHGVGQGLLGLEACAGRG